MIYADTDFVLAILKEKDWLKEKSLKLYKKHKKDIYISLAVMIEVILLGKRYGLNITKVAEDICALFTIKGISEGGFLAVTDLIEKKQMTMLDAFHAILSGDDPILTSDKAYAKVGKKTISLQP